MTDAQEQPRRRLPRFSLRSLILFVLLAGSGYGLWARWEPWVIERVINSKSAIPKLCVFTEDGQKIVTFDTSVVVWDLNMEKRLFEVKRTPGDIVFVRPSGKPFYPSHIIKLDKAKTGSMYYQITDVALGKKRVTLRNEGETREHRILESVGISLNTACSSPDGTRLVLWHPQDSSPPTLWDLHSGELVAVLIGNLNAGPNALLDYHYDDDKRIHYAEDVGSENWEDEERIYFQGGHSGSVLIADFSPDGNRVATGGEDGSIQLWNAATGRYKATLASFKYNVVELAFLPGGERLLAVTGDAKCRILDLRTRDVVREWPIAEAYVDTSPDNPMFETGEGISIEISADGRRLLVFGGLWDLETGLAVQRYFS